MCKALVLNMKNGVYTLSPVWLELGNKSIKGQIAQKKREGHYVTDSCFGARLWCQWETHGENSRCRHVHPSIWFDKGSCSQCFYSLITNLVIVTMKHTLMSVTFDHPIGSTVPNMKSNLTVMSYEITVLRKFGLKFFFFNFFCMET